MNDFIGKPLEALPTPCLWIDGPALRGNLRRMQAMAAQAGKQLRPHAKSHKCAAIARLQVEEGAVGICAAKLSEAEALVREGLPEVLLTGPAVTDEALDRLAACAAEARHGFLAVLEDLEVAARLSRRLVARGAALRCLVDLDVGQERTGFAPGEAAEAARKLAALPGLKLVGMQAYAGHLQHIPDAASRREANRRAIETACAVYRELKPLGLSILSVGGTGTCEWDLGFPEVTEIQPGSYPLMDADYGAVEFPSGAFGTALFLQTTVLSARHPGFATVDAGLKTLYRDGATPLVVQPQGVLYDWFGDEYGRVTPADGQAHRFAVGDRLHLAVSHCDPTVNLFDRFYAVEGGIVTQVWPIELRGLSQ